MESEQIIAKENSNINIKLKSCHVRKAQFRL
jgi:hypothetical protein